VGGKTIGIARREHRFNNSKHILHEFEGDGARASSCGLWASFMKWSLWAYVARGPASSGLWIGASGLAHHDWRIRIGASGLACMMLRLHSVVSWPT